MSLVTTISNKTIELGEDTQSAIAWTICSINAFVMLCSGLVIDASSLYRYLRSHTRWPVVVGLLCQMFFMPLLAFSFTPLLGEAQSFAVLIQGTCPGSAILNLFSAWCAGNSKLAQILTSIGTLSAIGLIPLWLSLYSSSYIPEYGETQIPVPYWPIVRTLLILISALLLGIGLRVLNPRVAKKISKFGTILSLFVILTFVVFGELFYEGAWQVEPNMWLCVITIPLIGYTIGFMFGCVGRYIVMCLANQKFGFMEPQAIMEYDWSEIRTIGLACGLQNTQFAMSSIFSSFYSFGFVVKMHAYSPMYGVIEMSYAFILAGVWKLLESQYYRVKANGPRIPQLNITEYTEESSEEIRKRKETEEKIISVLRRRLPTKLFDTLKQSDLDPHTIEQMHTTVHRTLNSYLSDPKDISDDELQSIRQISNALSQLKTGDVSPAATTPEPTNEVRERITSHVTAFSVNKEDGGNKQLRKTPSRFSISKPIKKNKSDASLADDADFETAGSKWWSKLRNNWNPNLLKKMTRSSISDDYTVQETVDTFVKNDTIEATNKPDSFQSIENRFHKLPVNASAVSLMKDAPVEHDQHAEIVIEAILETAELDPESAVVEMPTPVPMPLSRQTSRFSVMTVACAASKDVVTETDEVKVQGQPLTEDPFQSAPEKVTKVSFSTETRKTGRFAAVPVNQTVENAPKKSVNLDEQINDEVIVKAGDNTNICRNQETGKTKMRKTPQNSTNNEKSVVNSKIDQMVHNYMESEVDCGMNSAETISFEKSENQVQIEYVEHKEDYNGPSLSVASSDSDSLPEPTPMSKRRMKRHINRFTISVTEDPELCDDDVFD